jgi:hypothetical protein
VVVAWSEFAWPKELGAAFSRIANALRWVRHSCLRLPDRNARVEQAVLHDLQVQ